MHLFLKRGSVYFLFCLYFLLQPGGPCAYAQRTMSPAQWQQLTGNKAFGYKNDSEQVTPPKHYNTGFIQKFLRGLFSFFGSGFGNALLWLILIGMGCYVVYRLFFSKDSFLFSRTKKIMSDEGPKQEEEDIANTNWEALLQKASANNDVRLAVRYSYMWLLQLLQERELIKYRSDKTNYEYYSELVTTDYKQPFKQLSRQYEYTWYGNYPPSAAAYQEYLATFDNLKTQLRR